MSSKDKILKIRKDFPILDLNVHEGHPLVYLDNAATTLKPQSVIDAVNEYYSRGSANIHRGIHFLSEQATAQYEDSRRIIQEFIKAKHQHEIIFTTGTTEGINLVASSFGQKFVQAGDEVLISEMEHHSNIVPWQLLCERTGAILKVIPMNDEGELIQEEYQKLLGPKTKMVAFTHISNSLGTINPIKEMISIAKKHGCKVLIDAAQSVLHTPIDVVELDCDFLVFSGHKLLGPTGIGVLYGKEEILNQMPPYQGGGDMIERVTFAKTTFAPLPHKFEAGTPPIAQVIGLGKAVEYIQSIGFDLITSWENELLEYATKQLSEVPGLRPIGTAKNKSCIFSFVLEKVHPHDIGTFCDQDGVALRTGHHCTQPVMDHFKIPATARASFSFYNLKEEVDILRDSLIKTVRFFS